MPTKTPILASGYGAAMRSDRVCSSPTPSSDTPVRRNVLIIGDVGMGKSSLINLISGKNLATTSSGAKSCTLHSQEYPVTLGGVEFVLHDTAGLHEARGNMKKTEYLDAVRQASALISRLEQSGGIHLLVFCMKAGRVSITMQQTYTLFVEVFCNRQVPVVIAATHLETYECMEQWWSENESHIKEYGLRSDGHACVTATRGLKNAYSVKYDQSQEVIRKVLLEHSSRVAWTEEKASWVKRVIMHIRSWLSPSQAKQLKSSDVRKKLTKVCGLSAEEAKSVVRTMEQTRRTTADAREENKPRIDGKSLDVSYTSTTVIQHRLSQHRRWN